MLSRKGVRVLSQKGTKSPRKGVVLTIGTFDGVHRGHQTILNKTVALAHKAGRKSLAVTFYHPPRLFFFPQSGPCLITLLPEKVRLLKSGGIDRVNVLRFNGSLARLTADEFFQRYFISRYHVREIVVGYNFGFGHDRRGDTRYLEKRGAEMGIPVHVVSPVCLQDVPISSGQIRDHLRQGDLASANQKLGYLYFLEGRVETGDGLGRQLGFPTANLRMDPEKLVPPGVFAVKVTWPGGRAKKGMCNVGFRPTIRRPEAERRVEVNVLGFSGDLIGKKLRLDFIRKIRSEEKFNGLAALAKQIAHDRKVVAKMSL